MKKIGESYGDRIFNGVNWVLVTLMLVIVLYPLLFVISASISDPDLVNLGKVWLLPKEVTLDGYRRVFENQDIMIGYRNSLFYTVAGTLFDLCLTLPAGYALSKRYLPGKRIFMVFFVLTMYFSGGMIPTYLVVKNLGLLNKWITLVVTSGVSSFYLIITRTFFTNSLPQEIEEAAYCDGCSEIRSFFTIALPLSKALLSVLVLYYGIGHWNGYFRALIYLTDHNKTPLQLVLRDVLLQQEATLSMATGSTEDHLAAALRNLSLLRYAVIVVASIPVMIIYPFLQKYFEKGIMIGSLKG